MGISIINPCLNIIVKKSKGVLTCAFLDNQKWRSILNYSRIDHFIYFQRFVQIPSLKVRGMVENNMD